MSMTTFNRLRILRARKEAYEKAKAMEAASAEAPAEVAPVEEVAPVAEAPVEEAAPREPSHVEVALDMVRKKKSDAEKLKPKKD